MATDIEIARTIPLRPIAEIAEAAGIAADAVFPYGRYLAKLDLDYVDSLRDRPDGKLIRGRVRPPPL
jgi:formate--tetrahydrofolate ligase